MNNSDLISDSESDISLPSRDDVSLLEMLIQNERFRDALEEAMRVIKEPHEIVVEEQE